MMIKQGFSLGFHYLIDPNGNNSSFALDSSLVILLMAYARSMYTIDWDSAMGGILPLYKVLLVMVVGAFMPSLGRKYPVQEYVSAMLFVGGLIFFTLADANTSPNFSVIGVIMISGALVMDSFLGNLQEAIFTLNPDTSQMEMLFCSTVVGAPVLLLPMVLTGELFVAWKSCSEHPYVYGVLVFEAMATFIGQISVLSLIAIFGAATTAMVTTARKAVTLLLSYLIFTKPLTKQHCSGLLLISMGIVLRLLPDSKPPQRAVKSDNIRRIHHKDETCHQKILQMKRRDH